MIEFIMTMGKILFECLCMVGGYILLLFYFLGGCLILFVFDAVVLYFRDSYKKHKRVSVRRFNRYLVHDVYKEFIEEDDE